MRARSRRVARRYTVPDTAAAAAKIVIAHRTPTTEDSTPAPKLVRLTTRVTMAKSPAITRPRMPGSTRSCRPYVDIVHWAPPPRWATATVAMANTSPGDQAASVYDAANTIAAHPQMSRMRRSDPRAQRAARIGPSADPTPRAPSSRPVPRSPLPNASDDSTASWLTIPAPMPNVAFEDIRARITGS